jgi:ATP-dependent phosphoenolpyruvate carboxykinase
MQQSGNISSRDLVGRVASVYLSIPGGRSGTGKITVKVDRCSREVKAMADEEIPHGAPVVVKEHIQGNCYLVEKYSSSEKEAPEAEIKN